MNEEQLIDEMVRRRAVQNRNQGRIALAALKRAIADYLGKSAQEIRQRLAEEAGAPHVAEGRIENPWIAIDGFGTFVVRERAARSYSNPRTRQPIAAQRRLAVVFKGSMHLTDSLQ